MGLFKNLAGKALDLMTEDTVYSASQRDYDSSYELLLKASDNNYLDYVSAYVNLINKKKYPGGNFYRAIMDTINDRPSNIQNKARQFLNSAKKK